MPRHAPDFKFASPWQTVGTLFERFTDRARRVLELAQEEASAYNHGFVGTEHILLGLISEGEGVAAKALESLGVSLEAVRAKVEQTIGIAERAPRGSPLFTPRAKKVLELSLREALQLGHSYIGTEHILLGLVREGEGTASRILIGLGAEPGAVRIRVIDTMSGHIPNPEPGTSPTESSRHLWQSVTCSFCGRQHPDSVKVVVHGNAAICEPCVRKWAIFLKLDSGSADPPTEGPEAPSN